MAGGGGRSTTKNHDSSPQKTSTRKTDPPATKKQPIAEITSVKPADRRNACLFIVDKQKIRGVRNEWATGELSQVLMRGPADDSGIVDESMSAFAIFARVNFKTNDLPDVDTARF